MNKKRKLLTILLKSQNNNKNERIEVFKSLDWDIRMNKKYRLRINNKMYPKGKHTSLYSSETKELICQMINKQL